jgi:hypothetical protein
MEEVGGTESTDGIFIVRQGKGEDATYAICHRIDSVSGSQQITGTNKTAQQLVDEQRLEAAFVSSGTGGDFQSFSFEPATGSNVNVSYRQR